MSHYAKVVDGKVVQVIVADAAFFKSFVDSSPGKWIQTSYNTHGGVHFDPVTGQPSADQSQALRGNYAGVGFTYDVANDVFYAPQPFPSWTISAPEWIWKPPMAYPTDGKAYYWDEDQKNWTLVT